MNMNLERLYEDSILKLWMQAVCQNYLRFTFAIQSTV